MTTESIQLNVPKLLYQRIVGTAQQTQRDVHETLLEVIAQFFGTTADRQDSALDSAAHEQTAKILTSPTVFIHPRQAEMEAEVATFEALHDELWAIHANQYIAMNRGIVVDHDDDESLLVQRIDQQYPDDIVLIRQVQAELPAVLVVRSPRLESSMAINSTISQD